MKATICDICKKPMQNPTFYKVAVAEVDGESQVELYEDDVCLECFSSPIIYQERRRTRTRKPPVKRGRPRGSKKVETVEVGNADSPV